MSKIRLRDRAEPIIKEKPEAKWIHILAHIEHVLRI